MRTVVIVNHYPVKAECLWRVSLNLAALKNIAGRAVSFEGLPTGNFVEGQSLSVTVSLLGLLPRQAYHIDIIERNDENYTLRSSERGAGVNIWRHTVVVAEVDGHSMLVDKVEIEAGWLTLAASLWAKFIYRRRHWSRLALLMKCEHPAF